MITIRPAQADIVGTLPKAFRHQELGLVDAYVMYRMLDDIDDVDAMP